MRLLIFILPMFFLAGVAAAHHSVVPYDKSTVVELEGTVLAKRWRNPHIRITLRVESESGEVEEWDLESGAANVPARQGYSRESIQDGDRIRIAGWPSTRGRKEMYITNILLPNGDEMLTTPTQLALRWTGESAITATESTDSDLGRSIFRVWSFRELYRARKPLVYTPDAQESRANWNPYTDTLALDCIAPGMPNAILNPYPIEFIDEGEKIRLLIEEWDAIRVIHLDSATIPVHVPGSPFGYSIGRWDGDSLVIDTARVDFPYLDDEGTPMSDDVQIKERFTVSKDGNRLDYEISVTDPVNLVDTVTWDAAWHWIPGAKILPYECELQ